MSTNYNQHSAMATESLQSSQLVLSGKFESRVAGGVHLVTARQQESRQRLPKVRDAEDAAKSSFVANMSHEIKTPLTTIVGLAEVLLDLETDKSKQDMLQLIHQNCRQLATLVNDVLDLSKIEAGKLETDLTEVSPLKIIADVGDSMVQRANEKGLRFSIEYEGMIPESIETDAARIRQILFNLACNAVKFTEQGEVVVRCKLVDLNSCPALQIEFDDTGIGFKESEVESLFEQFTQVDNSPTRRQGGSGSGLFLSRKIAELLGGRLTARKKKNAGSVFTLSLPVSDLQNRKMINPATAWSKTDEPDVSVCPSSSDLKGRRILVAEDSRGIQLLLKRILKDSGAEIDVAEDGQVAMEKLAANDSESKAPYDIILLDMQMPRMSGYDAAAAIRKAGLSTPIIALTASAMKGDREKCLNHGCDVYLTKPIDRRMLLTKITGQLSK